MCQALGYEVKDLVRVRVMNIYLDGLKEGEYRETDGRELEELYDMIKDSPEQHTGGNSPVCRRQNSGRTAPADPAV